jgi:hypothetical protein bacD2_07783
MKLRYLFFVAAASTLAAACSEVDELASSSSQKTLETIQSGTDNFTTRVNLDSQWEAGDAIGVYMLDAGKGDIRNSAMNIQYNAEVIETSTTTNFVAANEGIGIFDQPCDFKAYYPYSPNEGGKVDMGAGLYNIDLSDQTDGISAHDLMWAEKNGMETADLQNNGLSLTFRHKLVLLRVHVKGNVTAENVTVSGLNTVATFDLLSGTLSEGSTPKSVSLYRTDEKNVFMGIMLPTTELRNKMKLSITTTDGKKYQYTVPDNSTVEEFVSGCKYEYTINVESDDSSLEGGSGDNKPWGDGGTESGDGDEVLDNKDIPEGYTQVTVATDDDLTGLLNRYKENESIALIFPEGEYTSGKITVPAEVKELLFISKTENQSKLTLTGGIAWENQTLKNLGFNNLEITGRGVQLIADNSALSDGGTAVLKNCHIYDMKDVFSGKNIPTTMSLTVDNCHLETTNLLYQYKLKDLVIKNSTFYKMAYIIKADVVATATIENSTVIDIENTPFETGNDKAPMTYNNNISALIKHKYDNLFFRFAVVGSDNYAIVENDGTLAIGGIDEKCFVNTTTTISNAFTNLDEGNLTLLIDAKVGDPRWYKSVE